jgi:60 kDa SS-A/Ro ribonucleoprotein
MRTNVAIPGPDTRTHEGTPAPRLTPIKALRRRVLTALLWEDTFYEPGWQIASAIAELIPTCRASDVAALAIEAREQMHLRHVPLFLARELARITGHGPLIADTLARVIRRPDELGEYLSLYWKDQADAVKSQLSAGSKRGLARAFATFGEYALGKYDREAAVKLRDVLRLVHPKPKDADQAALWKRVTKRELATPDTWETALSAGKAPKDTWERLMREQKLGGLAFLRNLRNMVAANVDLGVIRAHFVDAEQSFAQVLPFRFIAAARHVPRLEPELEVAMLRSVASLPKLAGTTALVIDTSPSMWMAKVSAKSELDRFDAAAALTILAREVCADVHVWAFNHTVYEVPSRRGFALRDALAATKGQASCGGLGVAAANARGYDRIIVLTDGQWHYADFATRHREGSAQEVSPPPLTAHAYMINVAPYQHGVGDGRWQSIDGWSERILDYIGALETEPLA